MHTEVINVVKENIFMRGEFTIETIDALTGERKEQTLKNTLTNINRDIHLTLLLGTIDAGQLNNLNIQQMAFGDNNTPASAAQTLLVNERGRKQFTRKERPTGQNYVEVMVSLGSGDMNFHIQEIGLFAGADATSTASANSGTMVSRIVVDIEKFENKIVNIIWRGYVSI
jgi:hypothetical protein